MKLPFIYILFQMICTCGFAQTDDTSRYYRIDNFVIDKTKTDTTSIKYLKSTGEKLIDIRTASTQEIQKIKENDRIRSIEKDSLWYNVRDAKYNKSAAIVATYETGPTDTVYQGIPAKWGNVFIKTAVISGKSSVGFADVLINKNNARNYRYHVIQNDRKEIIPWTIPADFRKTKDEKVSYAYLGKFDYAPGQFIKIEIYNINDYADRSAFIVDWRETIAFKPFATVQYTTSDYSTIFSASLNDSSEKRHNNFIKTNSTNDKRLILSDSLININFRNSSIQIPDYYYQYQVLLTRKIHNKTETLNLGDYSTSVTLDKIYWNQPGKYTLTFTPKLLTLRTPFPESGNFKTRLFEEKNVVYSFTVLPPLNSAISFSTKELILIIVSLGILFLLIFLFYKNRNRKKIAHIFQQKEHAKMQLGLIRAQLNPHFMFNALAGIQNLINKNEIDSANKYLGKFTRLTRSVLNNANTDLISINDERALLDDYLQMEQMRFGFQYEINIDKNIDAENIEIPTMLLQPFVENAVKHGAGELKADGRICINFKSLKNDLVIEIIDNGSGFESNKVYNGMGLHLSKNRIQLLNTIYQQTLLKLDMLSNAKGTSIYLHLHNWI